CVRKSWISSGVGRLGDFFRSFRSLRMFFLIGPISNTIRRRPANCWAVSQFIKLVENYAKTLRSPVRYRLELLTREYIGIILRFLKKGCLSLCRLRPLVCSTEIVNKPAPRELSYGLQCS